MSEHDEFFRGIKGRARRVTQEPEPEDHAPSDGIVS
jgi:hypothetical protein